eukprot:Blabericola_migrator_1__543@NODE_1133_length_5329_cov_658_167807_g752_i2_p6_GENE_NODE_1133_length_5329_cov_658_167807_g752_i2NODE_1133_length_5329_cov_658_167807_g752_i2_p6_ORF_typecomplete_len113_score1_67_NODE_1133_length_5329_cov_658_167807_g752_i238134151
MKNLCLCQYYATPYNNPSTSTRILFHPKQRDPCKPLKQTSLQSRQHNATDKGAKAIATQGSGIHLDCRQRCRVNDSSEPMPMMLRNPHTPSTACKDFTCTLRLLYLPANPLD